jgi:CRP-like cAMP-binding protein
MVLLIAGPALPNPLQVAAELRRVVPAAELPILVIVGPEEPPRAAELLAEDTDFVTRPWSPPMLRTRVRSWVARTGSSRPRRARPPTTRRVASVQGEGTPVPDLFRGLPARELAALLGTAATCRFAPGEVVYRQGETAGGVFHIRSGTLRVTTRTADGREIVLAALGPGNTVGEVAALDAGPHSATVMALEPTVADHVAREVFVSGLSQAPQASLRLLRILAGRLRDNNRLIADVALANLHGRIAHYLCAAETQPVPLAALAAAVRASDAQLKTALTLLESTRLIRSGDDGVEVLDREGLCRLFDPRAGRPTAADDWAADAALPANLAG